jgi:hypothetical protein
MIWSMNPLDRTVPEGIIDDLRQKRFAWNRSALFDGLVMFLAYDLLDYLHHPQRRLTDKNEPLFQVFLFVLWVGGSWARAEWHRCRIERQKNELSLSE